MSEERLIDYDALLHEAFRDAQRSVMRTILSRVAEQGLPGEHHFYISFNTHAPGVSIAPRLLQKYPGEMTIVLQHRFWDLVVQHDRFEVKLTFDSIRERLVIPFTAVRVFFDPSVPYGLQFDEPGEGRTAQSGELIGRPGVRSPGRSTNDRKRSTRKSKTDQPQDNALRDASETAGSPPTLAPSPEPQMSLDDVAPTPPAKTGPRLVETPSEGAKIVSLDQFRKK